MRIRPTSRMVVLDPAGRVLLFLFRHTSGAHAGREYWVTPGGEVEAGETFEQAALRELYEETGISDVVLEPELGRRAIPLTLTDGEQVIAEERYFLVRLEPRELSRDGWTDAERDMIAEQRWWTADELASTREIVYPEGLLLEMIAKAAL